MKKLILQSSILSLAISAIAFSSVANAKDGAFASLYTGATFASKETGDNALKLKTGPLFGLAGGYNYQDFTFGLSLEMRTAKQKVDAGASSAKLKANILLANAAYNFNTANDALKPYVGIGLGVAQNKYDYMGTTYKLKTAVAYQLQGGVKYAVHENVQLFGDLRYTGVAKAAFKDASVTGKNGVNFFSVNVGASYLF